MRYYKISEYYLINDHWSHVKTSVIVLHSFSFSLAVKFRKIVSITKRQYLIHNIINIFFTFWLGEGKQTDVGRLTTTTAVVELQRSAATFSF